MPVNCVTSVAVVDTPVNSTAVGEPTPVDPTSVETTPIDPTVLAPELHLYLGEEEIDFGDILELSSGVHEITIRNEGDANLHIGVITVDDEDFSVTQPVETTIAAGGETTFTVTVP